MAIPDFQSVMLPLLRFVSDGAEHSLREAIDELAKEFQLTDQERNALLESGQQAIFDNRVGWARTYLKKAGLLESTRRAHFRITARGLQLLQEKPSHVTSKSLYRYPEFVEFKTRREASDEVTDASITASDLKTPEEILEEAYLRVRTDLAAELLHQISHLSPSFFERLVVDLLVKMGYGGTRKDAGQAIGRSGDEGIDGVIKEDRLGLDVIYLQAKRWDNAVGRPEIQKFVGALQGQRARKGIFLTTSSFTDNARAYVDKIQDKVVLIDGEMLADLMIDHNIGVSTVASYNIKRIDSDYFTEEQ